MNKKELQAQLNFLKIPISKNKIKKSDITRILASQENNGSSEANGYNWSYDAFAQNSKSYSNYLKSIEAAPWCTNAEKMFIKEITNRISELTALIGKKSGVKQPLWRIL